MTPLLPLPTAMPVLPHVQIGVHHQLMPEGVVGGDWLTAVPLDSGDVALVVGDVVGRAAEAESSMHHLKAVAQHLLEQGEDPVGVLDQLDEAARRHPEARGATAIAAVIDPGTGHVVVAQRGHLPPVVVPRSGPAHAVDVAPSSPLGMPGRAALCEVDLRDDDAIALFTDGLVERSATSIGAGIDRLASTATEVLCADRRDGSRRDVSDLTSTIVGHLRDDPGGAADEALLVLARYRREPAEDLRIPFMALPSSLAEVRHRVGAWLDDAGACENDRFSLVQAISEAVGNLAHLQAADETRSIQLDLAASVGRDGRARVSITDDNDWSDLLESRESQPPPEMAAPLADRLPMSDRNRALVLMLDLVDAMTVDRLVIGTRVTLEKSLRRERVHVSTAASARPQAAALDVRAMRDGETLALAVRGPVEVETVETLRLAVLAALGDERQPLLLDLEEVTLLSGVGVRLLHDLARGGLVRIRAPETSPAHATLELTAVPHESTALHDLG